MRINGVYLSYDIFDKKQAKAVKDNCLLLVNAYEKMKNDSEFSESDKEDIISETYSFFGEVFGDEKAFEVLGENANLTECMFAFADFMEQFNAMKNKVNNLDGIVNQMSGNRKMKRAIVHKKK